MGERIGRGPVGRLRLGHRGFHRVEAPGRALGHRLHDLLAHGAGGPGLQVPSQLGRRVAPSQLVALGAGFFERGPRGADPLLRGGNRPLRGGQGLPGRFQRGALVGEGAIEPVGLRCEIGELLGLGPGPQEGRVPVRVEADGGQGGFGGLLLRLEPRPLAVGFGEGGLGLPGLRLFALDVGRQGREVAAGAPHRRGDLQALGHRGLRGLEP